MARSFQIHGALVTSLLILFPLPARAVPEQHGRTIATSGGAAGPHRACARCHGTTGLGDAAGLVPHLAGQDPVYLYKQLADYASGARPNDIMGPVAQSLSPADWAAAAYHYAEMKPPEMPHRSGSAPITRLIEEGDRERGIPSCGSCHGTGAEARPPASPVLDGMFADYISFQLRLWREDKRRNDPMHRMRAIARRLTDAEIDAVAAHYAGRSPAEGD